MLNERLAPIGATDPTDLSGLVASSILSRGDGHDDATIGARVIEAYHPGASPGTSAPFRFPAYAVDDVEIDGVAYVRMHRDDGWVHLESPQTGRCFGMPGPDGMPRLPTTEQFAALVAEGRAAVRERPLPSRPGRRRAVLDAAAPPLKGARMVELLMSAMAGKTMSGTA